MDRLDKYVKMRRLGYNQEHIARACMVRQATVSKYFNGKSNNEVIDRFVSKILRTGIPVMS